MIGEGRLTWIVWSLLQSTGMSCSPSTRSINKGNIDRFSPCNCTLLESASLWHIARFPLAYIVQIEVEINGSRDVFDSNCGRLDITRLCKDCIGHFGGVDSHDEMGAYLYVLLPPPLPTVLGSHEHTGDWHCESRTRFPSCLLFSHRPFASSE